MDVVLGTGGKDALDSLRVECPGHSPVLVHIAYHGMAEVSPLMTLAHLLDV